ncbi:MAG: DUF2911 domain-containing protein [Acidobacteriota bacterium]|nr:DUF2911 domain-containing protein [Acidobacteriota bacterium]
MRNRISVLTTLLLTAVMCGLAYAQEPAAKKPPQSPAATAEANVDGKKISVKYSAPSMRGRKIMGELVPYDKVWRTGANAATILMTEADLKIGELMVPKGTYTLYTLPGQKEWKLIVSKQTGQWGTEYSEAQDLGRVTASVKQASAPVELFAIKIDSTGGKNGVLKMMWETTEVSVPFTVQ